MLNLLRNKSQLYLFAPEPLSVTVLSRQDAEEQAPTFGSNDFVVSIGNPEQTELHFPCSSLHLHFFDKEDDRCITEEQADALAAFVRKEIGLGRHHFIVHCNQEYLEVRALLLRFCVHLDSMKELFWMMADIVSMAGAISTCAAHLA